MPNRMLRDWTDSERMNSLSVHAERFFVRLIMKADDYGCFYADQRILKANLFPLLLDAVREADLLRWMAECQKAGLIVLYESSGKKYLQISDFNQRLRAKKSKYPLPTYDCHLSDIRPLEVEEKLEVEVEEKSNAPNGFYEKENEKLFSIDHCAEVAMKDNTWVMNSKADQVKIESFKKSLRGQGITEKSLKDFKKHFFFWSEKQNSNGKNTQRSISAAGNRSLITETGGFGKL